MYHRAIELVMFDHKLMNDGDVAFDARVNGTNLCNSINKVHRPVSFCWVHDVGR